MLDSAEWAQAHRMPLNGDGSVLLQHDGEAIYIGFQGPPDGWAHVYLAGSDSVHVLHASAALGTASYTRQGDLWEPVREFSWEIRGRQLTDELRSARQAYLNREGWAASTMAMGTNGEIEYRVAVDRLTASPAIAFAYSSDPAVVLYAPATLTDSTIAPSLVRGDTPDALRFAPQQWLQLDLE